MRRTSISTIVLAIALAAPHAAHAQNHQLQGFGGLTFGSVTSSSTFGGGAAVPLSDNLHIIAEGGRMTNVMPSLIDTVVDLTPFDVGVSAWYGEGGVRFIGSSRQAIRPYVEATAGFARLTTGFHGLGSKDAVVNTALQFLDSTKPLLGLGSGFVVQGGPVFADIGYRYKKIVAGDSLQSILTGGDISVNQVRVGVGVRF
jgi:hypothetical protein